MIDNYFGEIYKDLIINQNLYESLKFYPNCWNLLHLIVLFNPGLLCIVDFSSKDIDGRISIKCYIVDQFQYTALYYALSLNLPYEAINNLFKYILVQIESEICGSLNGQCSTRLKQILDALSNIFPILVHVCSSDDIMRFLSICCKRPNLLEQNTFPSIGNIKHERHWLAFCASSIFEIISPKIHNTSIIIPQNSILISRYDQDQIYQKEGLYRVEFEIILLKLDYSFSSVDIIPLMLFFKRTTENSIVTCPSTTAIVNYLFKKIEIYHWAHFIWYMVFLILTTIYFASETYESTLEVIIFFLIGSFGLFKLIQSCRPRYSRPNLLQIIDFALIILVCITLVLKRQNSTDDYQELRKLVNIIIRIIIGTLSIFLICLIVICGTATIFYTMGTYSEELHTYLDYLLYSYNLLYQGLDLQNDLSSLEKFTFIASTFVLSVVLLNLLIAIMFSIFEEIRQSQEYTDNITKMDMILEVYQLFHRTPRRPINKHHLAYCKRV